MCCFFTTLVLLGPRVAVMIWWLMRPGYFMLVFGSFIIPLLGLFFLPWTTLMYLILGGTPIFGLDFLWLGLAILADIGMYAGGGYANRDRIPGYGV
jgi:hypothetical protein